LTDLGFTHVFRPATRPGAPTLLLLHGTGADEYDLLGLGHSLAPGAALLSPRGRVDENGAARWFRRLREGVFDVDDVVARAAELAGFVRAATAAYDLDPASVTAVGFSNGANMAAATLLLHPGLLRRAALFAAAAPLQGRPLPAADLTGVQVFLSAGAADSLTPLEQARLLAEQLRQCSAVVQMHEHPGGHGLPPEALHRARQWFAATTR